MLPKAISNLNTVRDTSRPTINLKNGLLLNVKRQLHPRATWAFFLLNLSMFTGYIIAMAIIYPVFSIAVNFESGNDPFSFTFLRFIIINTSKLVFIIICIIILSIAYLIAKLTYNFYRFELTDIEYKQEHGILTKSYVSIPYERIQNINISRGIIDRILGLSNIGIQTAGSNFGSEGFLYGLGVKEAEELKIKLIEMSKIAKDLS